MKKGMIITILILVNLFIVGGILIVIGLVMGGSMSFNVDYKRKKVEAEKERSVIQNEVELDEFNALSMDIDAAAFTIVQGDGYKVSYRLLDNEEPSISVSKDGVLEMKRKNDSSMHFELGNLFSSDSKEDDEAYYVSITVPEGTSFEDSTIDVDAGEIKIDGFDFKDLKIDNDTGNVVLSNMNADDLVLDVDAASIELSDLVCKKLTIDSDAGNVTLDTVKADVADLVIDYGTLKVNSSELGKLKCDLDAGDSEFADIRVSELEMDVDCGNVKLDIAGEEADYRIEAQIDAGELTVDGQKIKGDLAAKPNNSNSDKYIKLDIDAGDATINFK